MDFEIYFLLLTWHLYYRISLVSTLNIDKEPKCAYENTVNLTNHHKYQNGSFLYQGKIIPPEILALYDYAVLWGTKKSVPLHVRGCICDKYPCIRLCCEKDEYFDEITKKCEKLRNDILMIWQLRIEGLVGKFKVSDILNEFIIEIGLPCLESMTLNLIADTTTLSQTGLLQTPYKRYESSEFCYSPHSSDNSIYTLKPFTCLLNADNLEKNKFSKGFISILFLIPTTLLYHFLKELRENLSGKLYFYYLFAITMSNVIFALLNSMYFLWNGIWIIIMGFTGLVLHIIAISWLSIFSYDIWRNCKSKMMSKLFTIYCLCVGLNVFLASSLIIFKKLSKSYPLESEEMFEEVLWWNNQRWSSLQIIIPSILILFFNCIKLFHIMVVITKRRDSGTHNKLIFKKNAIIFLRLFIILVIPWSLKILKFSIAEAVQGTMIFLSSVFRRKIWILLEQNIKKSRLPEENVINTETIE
ncbi:probable G-protein coupled receptor Mth-like 3 isoform X2 [Lucilia sericata]|uniref:probable G-protein coupled receptor Mth-like 3 isoform X2 n=1 Tax=Lucilia sericata TaxID=13632 RepID=UPI0018A82A21|nr:probable G-protein coupled receptor Mth-like 3 isoform X2 [Lucilia sericata]